MKKKIFEEGMVKLLLAHPGLNPSVDTQDFWRDLLSDLSDWQFWEAVTKICRNVRDIHANTNLAALIREHSPAIPEDKTAERELEDFLEGTRDVRGIVNKINPGTWDPAWVQSEISFDLKGAPEEHCSWCGDFILYYWVKEPFLYRRWGQKQPFWLRVSCANCNEGKGSIGGGSPKRQ